MSKDGLNTAADDIKSASDTLISDLKGLGKPDTKQGQDAKDSVDQLSSELKDEANQIESDVKNISGVQGAATAAQSVEHDALDDEEPGQIGHDEARSGQPGRRAPAGFPELVGLRQPDELLFLAHRAPA